MNVCHVLASNFEVAQCDAWKGHIALLGPVDVVGHVTHDVGSERVVLGGEHRVQQEQLTDHVADVEDLRHEE